MRLYRYGNAPGWVPLPLVRPRTSLRANTIESELSIAFVHWPLPHASIGTQIESTIHFRSLVRRSLVKQRSRHFSCGVVHRHCLVPLMLPCTYVPSPDTRLSKYLPSAQTGETVDDGRGFIQFLGPTFSEVEEKFRQWLQLTYSTKRIRDGIPCHANISTQPTMSFNVAKRSSPLSHLLHPRLLYQEISQPQSHSHRAQPNRQLQHQL